MAASKRTRTRTMAEDWPWPKNQWATTGNLETLCAATSSVLGQEFNTLREELSSRIAELESKIYVIETTQLRYRGTWKPGTYNEGSVVTSSGSMWIAKSVTSERPGNGATAWQLTVKRGGRYE